jgi:formylglycine-generating enzyme required for sulfatase activity
MVSIRGGAYVPLFQDRQDGAQVAVEPFYLDVYAVTNAQYLAFVTVHPEWQRAHVPRLFADQAYLHHWPGEAWFAAADETFGRRPVTYVSWFAARAYCQWQGKRLPSVAEWEYVGQASETAPDGRQDPAYLRRILEWYALPAAALPPPVGSGLQNYWGVHDMHGVIWEWVADFQTALVTGESRGDSDFERNLFCGAGAVGMASQDRTNYAAFLRYAYRSSLRGHYTVHNLGFRCAKDAP